jgi:hypothetical protein
MGGEVETMLDTAGFALGPEQLLDMADALAIEAEIMAEEGDFATAALLRDRAALYHEFLSVTKPEAARDVLAN